MPAPFRPSLDDAFRIAYAIGLFMCLCCPIILFLYLDVIITPIQILSCETVQNLGYTLTGIITFCTLAVNSRWRLIRSNFSNITKNKQGTILLRETILYSMVFGLSSLFGTTYYLFGGIPVKQFARNFIALTPIMFFLFVPRLYAWRKASNISSHN